MNALPDWSEQYMFPLEYSDIEWHDGYNFFRVTRPDAVRMRRDYGVDAACGWYYASTVIDQTEPAIGPFRSLFAAVCDARGDA